MLFGSFRHDRNFRPSWQSLLALSVAILLTLTAKANEPDSIAKASSRQLSFHATDDGVSTWSDESSLAITLVDLPAHGSPWQWRWTGGSTTEPIASGQLQPDGEAFSPILLARRPDPGIYQLQLISTAPAPEKTSTWQRWWRWSGPRPDEIPAAARTARAWTFVVLRQAERPSGMIVDTPTQASDAKRTLLAKISLTEGVTDEAVSATKIVGLIDDQLTLAQQSGARGIVLPLRANSSVSADSKHVTGDWPVQWAIAEAAERSLDVYLYPATPWAGSTTDSAPSTFDSASTWSGQSLRRWLDVPGVAGLVLVGTGSVPAGDEWSSVLSSKQLFLAANPLTTPVGATDSVAVTRQWIARWQSVSPNCLVLAIRQRDAASCLSGQFVTQASALEKGLAAQVRGHWLLTQDVPSDREAIATLPAPPSDSMPPVAGRPGSRLADVIRPASWRLNANNREELLVNVTGRETNHPAGPWLRDFSDLIVQRAGQSDAPQDWLIVEATGLADKSARVAIELWRHPMAQPGRWLPADASASRTLRVWHVPGSLSVQTSSPIPENASCGDVFVLINDAPWWQRVTMLVPPKTSFTSVWSPSSGPTTITATASGAMRGFSPQPPVLASVALTLPSVSDRGVTIDVPPTTWLVVQTQEPLERSPQIQIELPQSTLATKTITQQVTLVVERLGLINQLEQLSRHEAPIDSPSLLELERLRQLGDGREPERPPGQTSASIAPVSAISRVGVGLLPPLEAVTTATDRLGLTDFERAAGPLAPTTNPAVLQWSLADSEALRHTTADQHVDGGGLIHNGNFEAPAASSGGDATDARPPGWDASMSGVPGWMHAQHPVGAVRLDDRRPAAGRRCVRLHAGDESGSQAWLISPTIQTPTTGRLAVSMELRAQSAMVSESESIPAGTAAGLGLTSPPEPMGSLEKATVRIAIEGVCDGQPCRHAALVEIPVDGKWQPRDLVLQWLGVDPRRHTDLRLTIDNLSTATVWVDEVYVTDWFASRTERSELQSLSYLAVQGLQKSDLTAAAALLQNFWARQLLSMPAATRPIAEPGIGIDGEPTPIDRTIVPASGVTTPSGASRFVPAPVWGAENSPTSKVPPTGEDPGVARRWKDWLPAPLRF